MVSPTKWWRSLTRPSQILHPTHWQVSPTRWLFLTASLAMEASSIVLHVNKYWISISSTRVLANRKNIYRVEFFRKVCFSGPTNYVIRHKSEKGNMMSFPQAFCPSCCWTPAPRKRCKSIFSALVQAFKLYALEVILKSTFVILWS
jgi:hypothetical protein